MKRILLLCLLMVTLQPLSARKHLVIYQLSGEVQLRHSGSSEWYRAARRDSLDWNDRLMVPADGSVRLLDLRDNALYRIGPTEAATALELVVAARKQAASITARLNEEIAADLRDQHAQNENYSVKGVSYRGETAGDSFIRDLASALLGHPEGSGPLSYEIIAEEDGAFHFRLHSRADVPLYVNVLRRSAGRNSLCFETSVATDSFILLPPGREINLEAYSFLAGDSIFTVFGTVLPVDSRVLTRVLNHSEAGTGIPEGAMIGSRQ